MNCQGAAYKPTPRELAVIQQYALAHGPQWRSKLAANWNAGDYWRGLHAIELETLRLRGGIEWLKAFRI